MSIRLHWFLPTTGDSRTDLSQGNAVGSDQHRQTTERLPSITYLSQIARAAEDLGFDAALTPTSSWCEEAWVTTAALTQLTSRLRYLVAFRPGVVAPLLTAQMAATYQRMSAGRLLLNLVVGGDDAEQLRYGDDYSKDRRYARAREFVTILRRLWTGEPVDHAGEHYQLRDARLRNPPAWPEVYLGGSSAAAIETAAAHAEVYLTWGEPPGLVAEKLDRVRAAAAARGRSVRFGIRLHLITRDTSAEAWDEASRLLSLIDDAEIARAQRVLRGSQSEGQQRMLTLHGGRTDQLEVAPNLWAGVGLVRGGAGTALVGSHEEVADRVAEYHALGIDEFIVSGYPHLEEAYRVGEGLIPELRRRQLLPEPGRPV